MSQTYVANLVQILSWAAVYFDWKITDNEWETTIKVVAAVLAGLWVFVRRFQVGDIGIFGTRI